MSTGVEGDLDSASKLARSMVVSYGMSETFGPISIGEKAGEGFLGRDIQNMGNISPVQLELIDTEVRAMVLNAFETAQTVIRGNGGAMDELVSTLLGRESVRGV